MNVLQPEELARWLSAGRPCRILDVREAGEWAIGHIAQAELLPLSEAARWLPRLAAEPGDAPLVVCCHHGVRSARVCGLLRQHGVEEVWNLAGGIEAWSLRVDPTIARY